MGTQTSSDGHSVLFRWALRPQCHSHREGSEMPVFFRWALRPLQMGTQTSSDGHSDHSAQCGGRTMVVCWARSSLHLGQGVPGIYRFFFLPVSIEHRLVGLVVRRPPRERKIPGSYPAFAGIFSGSSHTSDSKIATPVATLPGAWRYRVSAGTGRPGVSIL